MNSEQKLTIRSSKLKVHRENSQTISSYPVRFFTDITFSSLVSITIFRGEMTVDFEVFWAVLGSYLMFKQNCRLVLDRIPKG